MSRVGSKRSDRRWKDSDGRVWDSRLECEVYYACIKAGFEVRRCDERDSLNYTTAVRAGRCLECGSNGVVQERVYTPDLFVRTSASSDPLLVEVKGYVRQDRRSQLREALRQNPDANVCFVLGSKYTRATKKLRLWEYLEKYTKRSVYIWEGEIPDAWRDS